MLKKFLVSGLSLLMALSIVFVSIPKTTNAATLNKATTFSNEQSNEITITPYSNESGTGTGAGGNFYYYNYGVVEYSHALSCSGKVGPHSTIYLPSSFIQKVNDNVGNWTTPLVIGGVAKLLGTTISNPIAIAVGTALALQWATITWKDNGSGVTLVFGSAILPDKVVSGCNYYAH